MGFDEGTLLGLLAAFGGGLLVGTERERRKGVGPARGVAGVRTYSLAALLGAVAAMLGTPVLLLAGAGVLTLVAIGYLRTREHDPGLTSETALLLVFLLGALALHAAQIAAALFVLVTIVLAGKQRMHRFVRQVLSE
ncbi:MAG TPA: MgtC/SapB family protein, partial [Mizugakiibacter sp.]